MTVTEIETVSSGPENGSVLPAEYRCADARALVAANDDKLRCFVQTFDHL
jgi:hypothetical protein